VPVILHLNMWHIIWLNSFGSQVIYAAGQSKSLFEI